MNELIAIDGIQIHQDKKGHYSLNDLHKAAGGEHRHQPHYWLQLLQTIELIEAISNSRDSGNCNPVSSSSGRYGGTYVCKELVYAYAMWISADFNLKVIRTFDAVVTGKLQTNPLKQVTDAARAFSAVQRMVKGLGCDNNAAAISANQAIIKIAGINLLEATGQVHLLAEKQENFYTPSEIGKPIGISGKAVNLLLSDAGLQRKPNDSWELTERGKEFGRVYDTGKKHGSGVPITQIKWSVNVQELLNKEKEVA